ncbi:3-phosphoserine/phosphohydroxythreonine transaminase [Christensenellaceae bacterium NSJ-44]|uniref:Phosphoserine aminotransferase n=1 Tax=Luoshenia tenuis TaxID=2763654 RepID=A0A926D1E1_9FIRM|nr:3-phosphoserine/phosphohydroxythreonine transaminase [Luoshenia tenuis]MBC8529451.1 3-phosphoserine/phosphohydroxythreonine transaminase [Luoshenia tenuis]
MENRVYNFSAGPSMLPLSVLQKAQAELLNCNGSGSSVMEMSHRSAPYEAIIAEAESLLRELMQIPDNYKVLFIQGGATQQFSMVPMNLKVNGKADYIVSGNFANNAAKEAAKFVDVNIVANSKPQNYAEIPAFDSKDFDPEADYVHITSNNTIFGTRYTQWPETGNVPLVADMSSNILSEPMDVSRFGLIYAGAQKNIGIAGLAVVIIREDLLSRSCDKLPVLMNYNTYANNDSMYNTPPCFAIYMAKLVFEWIKEQGGVAAVYENNVKKAAILYDYLDSSSFFKATAKKEDRSLMNIPFVTPSKELDAQFVKEAAQQGFVNIKGHRLVGGMRASIYNAMPNEGIEKLVAFMRDFEARNK